MPRGEILIEELLEIVDDRYDRGSLLVTSQVRSIAGMK